MHLLTHWAQHCAEGTGVCVWQTVPDCFLKELPFQWWGRDTQTNNCNPMMWAIRQVSEKRGGRQRRKATQFLGDIWEGFREGVTFDLGFERWGRVCQAEEAVKFGLQRGSVHAALWRKWHLAGLRTRRAEGVDRVTAGGWLGSGGQGLPYACWAVVSAFCGPMAVFFFFSFKWAVIWLNVSSEKEVIILVVEVKKTEGRNPTCPKAVNISWGCTKESPGIFQKHSCLTSLHAL